MEKKWVDFKAVKDAVSMEAALAHYSIKVYRANKDHVRGKCPLPTHTSPTSKLSFVVNTTKNVWSCKSDSCVAGREGKTGGNVLDFVAVMEKCSIREAAEKLASWFGVQAEIPLAPKTAAEATEEGTPPTPDPMVKPPSVESPKDEGQTSPLKFTLKGVDPAHPYLAHRGITRETAALFGVGFFPGKGSMVGRVVVPIHNGEGELIAYAGRSIDDAEPRYKLPENFKKSLVLFNLHRAKGQGRVVVVEGFFGTMKVHQAGFPGVVGLMGWSLSEEQEDLLAKHFHEAVLMLDGDEAGRKATPESAARLARKMFVRAVELATGAQPDRFSSEEIRAILGSL
jgi:DNA primase